MKINKNKGKRPVDPIEDRNSHTEQTSVKLTEAIKLSIRALRLLCAHCPGLLPARLLSAAFAALAPYVGIYLSARIIDELAGKRDPGQLQLLVLITLGSAAFLSLINTFLTKWKEARCAGEHLIVEKIFAEKLLDMDFIHLDDPQTHELLSLIRQSEYSGAWGLRQILKVCEETVSALLTLLLGIALSISLFTCRVPESAGRYTLLNHPFFILCVIAVMLAVTYLAPTLYNKAQSYWRLNADSHLLGNRLFSFYGFLGHKRDLAADMRIYRQDQICCRHCRDKKGTFGSQGPFARFSWGPSGLYRAASAAVSRVFTGVVYLFVCLKAWAGAFGLGAVTRYIASISKVADGVSSLISNLGYLRYNASFLIQVFQFLDIQNTMYQGSLTVEKRRDRDYEVEFRHVSFRYPGSETYALRNVNMKFKIGQRLAVVGMNGSGKTTFIKLLCRLYDPTEGTILLNGIDIRKYNYEDYRMIFSVVFQDFQLFSLKLCENVACQVTYDKEKVIRSLQKVGFGERLSQMPYGTETYLNKDFHKDGIHLSGGEAQKVAIARTLYRDTPFLILDEPTAALDPIAEAAIYNSFNEIIGDKTAIYISHRLSSCKFCDEIVVFHEGQVIQQGTHAALAADQTGKYYELWNAQAQYYTMW